MSCYGDHVSSRTRSRLLAASSRRVDPLAKYWDELPAEDALREVHALQQSYCDQFASVVASTRCKVAVIDNTLTATEDILKDETVAFFPFHHVLVANIPPDKQIPACLENGIPMVEHDCECTVKFCWWASFEDAWFKVECLCPYEENANPLWNAHFGKIGLDCSRMLDGWNPESTTLTISDGREGFGFKDPLPLLKLVLSEGISICRVTNAEIVRPSNSKDKPPFLKAFRNIARGEVIQFNPTTSWAVIDEFYAHHGGSFPVDSCKTLISYCMEVGSIYCPELVQEARLAINGSST